MKYLNMMLRLFLLLCCIPVVNAGRTPSKAGTTAKLVSKLHDKVISPNHEYHVHTAEGLTELLIDIATADTFRKRRSGTHSSSPIRKKRSREKKRDRRTSAAPSTPHMEPTSTSRKIRYIQEQLRYTLNKLIISSSIEYAAHPELLDAFVHSFSTDDAEQSTSIAVKVKEYLVKKRQAHCELLAKNEKSYALLVYFYHETLKKLFPYVFDSGSVSNPLHEYCTECNLKYFQDSNYRKRKDKLSQKLFYSPEQWAVSLLDQPSTTGSEKLERIRHCLAKFILLNEIEKNCLTHETKLSIAACSNALRTQIGDLANQLDEDTISQRPFTASHVLVIADYLLSSLVGGKSKNNTGSSEDNELTHIASELLKKFPSADLQEDDNSLVFSSDDEEEKTEFVVVHNEPDPLTLQGLKVSDDQLPIAQSKDQNESTSDKHAHSSLVPHIVLALTGVAVLAATAVGVCYAHANAKEEDDSTEAKKRILLDLELISQKRADEMNMHEIEAAFIKISKG